MPFNNSKNGYINEYEFVKILNNKKVKDLPFALHLFLLDIFGKIDENQIVTCTKNYELQKYDIFIKIDYRLKKISIKKV